MLLPAVLLVPLGFWPAVTLPCAPPTATVARAPQPAALANKSRDREARQKFRQMARMCHPDVAGGSVTAFQTLVDENNAAQHRARTQDDIQTVLAAVAASWLCFGAPHPDPITTLATLVAAAVLFDGQDGSHKTVCKFLPSKKMSSGLSATLADAQSWLAPKKAARVEQRKIFASAGTETAMKEPSRLEWVLPAVRHVSKSVASFWTTMTTYETVWEERAASM